MSIGENIKYLREHQKDGKMTQEKLAEEIGVSFQAISAWERDEYVPETKNVLSLMKAFDASADDILDGRKWEFETKETIYDWEHMKTYVKTTAKNKGMNDTLKAVDFAVKAHEGQHRKNTTLAYISHPLTLACHALALGIYDDAIVAACMLHDVIEDCKKKDDGRPYTLDDLPVNEETKELVRLMTKDKSKGSHNPETLDKYYGEIAKNPKAALIKCIDRCNNITTMSWGLGRDGIFRYIKEVEKYYPALLKVVKDTPEFNNAAWLLKYHIESMLDIYKRMI